MQYPTCTKCWRIWAILVKDGLLEGSLSQQLKDWTRNRQRLMWQTLQHLWYLTDVTSLLYLQRKWGGLFFLVRWENEGCNVSLVSHACWEFFLKYLWCYRKKLQLYTCFLFANQSLFAKFITLPCHQIFDWFWNICY